VRIGHPSTSVVPLGPLWWADLWSLCRRGRRHQDVALTTPVFLLWLALSSKAESNKCDLLLIFGLSRWRSKGFWGGLRFEALGTRVLFYRWWIEARGCSG